MDAQHKAVQQEASTLHKPSQEQPHAQCIIVQDVNLDKQGESSDSCLSSDCLSSDCLSSDCMSSADQDSAANV
jgi:hypothetical protein